MDVSTAGELSRPHAAGFAVEASPWGQDTSLTQSAAPPPFLEDAGGAENSQLLITGWSFW